MFAVLEELVLPEINDRSLHHNAPGILIVDGKPWKSLWYPTFDVRRKSGMWNENRESSGVTGAPASLDEPFFHLLRGRHGRLLYLTSYLWLCLIIMCKVTWFSDTCNHQECPSCRFWEVRIYSVLIWYWELYSWSDV